MVKFVVMMSQTGNLLFRIVATTVAKGVQHTSFKIHSWMHFVGPSIFQHRIVLLCQAIIYKSP